MTGMNAAEASMTFTFICAMNVSAMMIRIKVRTREVICSEMNRRIVCTSDVHRWIISPVLFSPSQV